MIKSMTGFGRGSSGSGPNKIDVEIRTVNSRFLEMKLRGFNLDPALEQKVRSTLETSLQRGNVQVRFELKSGQDSQQLSFNRKRFEILQDVVKKTSRKPYLSINKSLHFLLKLLFPQCFRLFNDFKTSSVSSPRNVGILKGIIIFFSCP